MSLTVIPESYHLSPPLLKYARPAVYFFPTAANVKAARNRKSPVSASRQVIQASTSTYIRKLRIPLIDVHNMVTAHLYEHRARNVKSRPPCLAGRLNQGPHGRDWRGAYHMYRGLPGPSRLLNFLPLAFEVTETDMVSTVSFVTRSGEARGGLRLARLVARSWTFKFVAETRTASVLGNG